MATTTPHNFTFHFVDSQETTALGAVLPVICIFIVALRFFIRHVQGVRIGIDDWLSVGGLVSTVEERDHYPGNDRVENL